METGQSVVRRATVDDLGILRRLWQQAGFDAIGLERRITEFQVVTATGGEICAAIGMRIELKQALLHHAAFADSKSAEQDQLVLWNRLQNLARNHGLTRLWTLDPSPFWGRNGFAPAEPQTRLERLPPAFGDKGAAWFTLQLKEESGAGVSLDKEFELFQQAQRDETERVMRQARVFKVLAWVLIALFVCLIAFLGYYVVGSSAGPRR